MTFAQLTEKSAAFVIARSILQPNLLTRHTAPAGSGPELSSDFSVIRVSGWFTFMKVLRRYLSPHTAAA
jgi:hypothetical protein